MTTRMVLRPASDGDWSFCAASGWTVEPSFVSSQWMNRRAAWVRGEGRFSEPAVGGDRSVLILFVTGGRFVLLSFLPMNIVP